MVRRIRVCICYSTRLSLLDCAFRSLDKLTLRMVLRVRNTIILITMGLLLAGLLFETIVSSRAAQPDVTAPPTLASNGDEQSLTNSYLVTGQFMSALAETQAIEYSLRVASKLELPPYDPNKTVIDVFRAVSQSEWMVRTLLAHETAILERLRSEQK